MHRYKAVKNITCGFRSYENQQTSPRLFETIIHSMTSSFRHTAAVIRGFHQPANQASTSPHVACRFVSFHQCSLCEGADGVGTDLKARKRIFFFN